MAIRHYDVAERFLRSFGFSDDYIDRLIPSEKNPEISDNELFERLSRYLESPKRRPLLLRIKVLRTFDELTEPEQRLLKRFMKNPMLFWLGDRFGLRVDRSLKEIRLFKGQMERNDFKLPDSMVSEILKVIALYKS